MKDEEKKDNIRKLFASNNPSKKGAVVPININGNHNISAGRDINGPINIDTRQVVRMPFTPGPEHITPEQAGKIQTLVSNLASKEVVGGMDSKKAFAKWYGALKGRYQVNSYKAIPRSLGDEVISWLKQYGAIKRSKIRRRNPDMWRNELYSAIWARSKEIGLSKGLIYGIVFDRLNKRVTSLTHLGEQDLKKLYAIVMKL